jgi:hypothetical protein
VSAFTKLDSGIVHSTIWVQPHDVLRVWIALLALADQNGFARTAAPSLAHLCMVPLDRMREIITVLESPDEDSRSEAHDGRRIVKVEGGWMLVNHAAYRAKRDPEADRDRKRDWDRQHRPSGHARTEQSDGSPTQSDTVRRSPLAPTQAEAEAEAEFLSDRSLHTPPSAAVGASFEGHAEPKATPNPAAAFAIALNKAGHRGCTSITPTLVAYVAEGGTVEHLLQVIAANDCAGKPGSYVLAIARRELAEKATPVTAGAASTRYSPPPARTTETVEQTRAKRDAEKPSKPANPEAAAEAIRMAREMLTMPAPATREKPERVSAEDKAAALAELTQRKELAA